MFGAWTHRMYWSNPNNRETFSPMRHYSCLCMITAWRFIEIMWDQPSVQCWVALWQFFTWCQTKSVNLRILTDCSWIPPCLSGSGPPGESCNEQWAPARNRPSADHTRLRESHQSTNRKYLHESIWYHQSDAFSDADSPGSVLLRWRPLLHRPAAAVSGQIPHLDCERRRPSTHHNAGRTWDCWSRI